MKASVLALALLCASPAVFAQAAPQASSREATRMDNLATLLDLTAAQKAQVQAVLQEEHAKMKDAFEQARASGTKPDWQQMKALHQQIQQETLQKLTPVLSATQLKKFQVLSQMGRHGHFRHGGPAGASSTAPSSQS
jgi:ribulose bisphosphate carboxylase small subunit